MKISFYPFHPESQKKKGFAKRNQSKSNNLLVFTIFVDIQKKMEGKTNFNFENFPKASSRTVLKENYKTLRILFIRPTFSTFCSLFGFRQGFSSPDF